MAERQEVIAGYFPVIHTGYLDVLNSVPSADVAVLGSDILSKRFDYLRKDIRALTPEQAALIFHGLGRKVRLIGERSIRSVMNTPHLTMPDDDVSHSLADEFDVTPIFSPVFLRWDRKNVTANLEVDADRTISLESDNELLRVLFEQRERSTNWWRHVAAAIVKDGELLSVHHNSSVPTPYTSAIESDPRITAKRGSAIELSIDMHAEAKAIATLAKHGTKVDGADIFVTTFPCPNCAKLIAESGIRRCYFTEGYAMLDGQSILKANDIEIIKILVDEPEDDPRSLRAYPSSRS